MIFVREFESGFGHDPRNKWYAVYKCDACGHEDYIHMPMPSIFNRNPRKCPKCHCLRAEDLRKSLAIKKAQLEAERARLDREIAELVVEMETKEDTQ